MIYLLIPHRAVSWEDFRFFLTYSAAEQQVLQTAVALAREGRQEDWCTLVGLDGVDEVRPYFVYTLEGGRLRRDSWPSPSP